MRKLLIICSIISLILFTALIKNSTKKIEDQIFTKQENLRILKSELGKMKLEYEYLSSAEKLLEFQNLYFEDELVKKDIQEIIIMDKEIAKFDFK